MPQVEKSRNDKVKVTRRDQVKVTHPITTAVYTQLLMTLCIKALDAHYPPECVIRLVLDNHSSHISKETMSWLATKPNRFLYVHTPKHGSWLNLVETLFGKMARTFLKHIRVASRQELKDRILLGIAEINEAPVVHRWKNFDALNL